ncbi:hypothetical protein T190820D02B_30355 [Tenacibaculum sp. 190524A05c]
MRNGIFPELFRVLNRKLLITLLLTPILPDYHEKKLSSNQKILIYNINKFLLSSISFSNYSTV